MEGEAAKGGTERLLLGMERSARDFLRRFVGNGYGDETAEVTEGDSDKIELSLGLSLGGFFGADPKGKKLVRSSSIASFTSLPWEPEFPVVPAAALTRTSSLPTETEEERRKRKEMQSFKRLEAKRKRLERRNSIRSAGLDGGWVEKGGFSAWELSADLTWISWERHRQRVFLGRPGTERY
ncbi:hypothetical protein GW17_00017431 [Ensete ventricosum]|nr:hypothetical protein GW17_00017431 [Ensete ventricosum]